MSRPYPHSLTGAYWLRKVVPAPLRALVGKRELVESLGTKDPKEAKERALPVLARFNAILAAAQAGGSRLTQREVEALAGDQFSLLPMMLSAEPGDPDCGAI